MVNIHSGGKKLAFGQNDDTTWKYMPSLHAEMDAYSKIKNFKGITKKVDLFVIRITKGGNLAESRPCFHCIDYLSRSKLKIQDVYYSTSKGIIVSESFCDMIKSNSKYITRGYRKKNK